jgi:thioredoxin 1
MQEVTDETFGEEVLASPVPVIVDFWAPWCRPCNAIEPHLRGIAEQNAGRVRLVRLNVDENLAVSGRYEVLALPTVVLFEGGEPRARVVGAHRRSRFESEFADWLRMPT